MICKEIFESALRLLGESAETGDNDDYEERAPYLLASLCTDLCELDSALCRSAGLEPSKASHPLWIALESEFPLCARLASAAAFYLAAMLVIDYDEELSDKLYDRYCDSVSVISSAIPFEIESIINRYI